MTRPAPPTIPAGDLLEHIAGLLAVSDRDTGELATLTGYSPVTIRWRLGVLEQDGRAHRIAVPIADAGGMLYRWKAGPAPVQVPRPPVSGRPPKKHVPRAKLPPPPNVESKRQRTVKRYPAINRRDPLVSALFGVAGER